MHAGLERVVLHAAERCHDAGVACRNGDIARKHDDEHTDQRQQLLFVDSPAHALAADKAHGNEKHEGKHDAEHKNNHCYSPFLYLGGFYGSAVYGLILSGRAQKIKAQMYKLTPAIFLPLRRSPAYRPHGQCGRRPSFFPPRAAGPPRSGRSAPAPAGCAGNPPARPDRCCHRPRCR